MELHEVDIIITITTAIKVNHSVTVVGVYGVTGVIRCAVPFPDFIF